MARLLTPPHRMDVGAVIVHPVTVTVWPPVETYPYLMPVHIVYRGHPDYLGDSSVYTLESHATSEAACWPLFESSDWCSY